MLSNSSSKPMLLTRTVDNVAKIILLHFTGPFLLNKDGSPVLNYQMMQYGLGSCSMDKFTLMLKSGPPTVKKNQVAYKRYFSRTYQACKEPSFTIDDQKDLGESYKPRPDIPVKYPPGFKPIELPPMATFNGCNSQI